MQNIQDWGIVSLAIILSLATLPQVSVGQTPTLDKLNLENSQSPQCLDFNQDKICEFIVLINGTMVENPDRVKQTTQALTSQSEHPPQQSSGQKLVPGDAYDFPKCLGHIEDGCKNILLSNGTMIKNPHNQSMTIYVQEKLDPQAYEDPNYYYYYPDSRPEIAADAATDKETATDEEAEGTSNVEDDVAEVSGDEGPSDEVNNGGELQQTRYYEGLDWRGICNNPLLGSYISQPCDVLVTPDGNALTSEGKVQLEGILCPRGPSILSTLEMFYGTISDNLKSELGTACGW